MAQGPGDVPPVGRGMLIAGVDWGGGGVSGVSRTVLVIGFIRSDNCFEIVRMDKFVASEEPEVVLNAVAQRCRQFKVSFIAADGGGNGHVYNRLLFDRLQCSARLYAILYSASGQAPRQDGALVKWTVNRSATIGALFSRIKKRLIVFPRVTECGSFLDEFAGETAVYDDINRSVRYSHPETQCDDALHATNYALLVAVRLFAAMKGTEEDFDQR